jgi:hypothetical protein
MALLLLNLIASTIAKAAKARATQRKKILAPRSPNRAFTQRAGVQCSIIHFGLNVEYKKKTETPMVTASISQSPQELSATEDQPLT